ncbi:MAG: N-6 DNA methylase [Acidobacteriia bacterium]|nr:N-6 DNA methylase [Terriglobia bacterium]
MQKLITKFQADREYYLSSKYLEAQARVDFVTPFFKALGWDVENEAGALHHQREVIVERGEAETEGRPDYSFRIAGQTRFFVEAKAPCETLSTPKHILQAKGYAWNTKQVSFVILTDFEEFRFYDASIRPDERMPDEGLLLSLKYTEYLRNAEKLWEFSRERVAAGSLDAMLPRDRRTQRLRIPVDAAFLDEMTGWREDLARNVFKNNPDLTAKQLNEIVQRLLDRIVFVRIAEDRRIIEKNQLRDAVEEWRARGGKFHIFDWLNDLFHKINDDFNGEIFKPHLSETIKIESEGLAKIIERLYPPKSPYRFDVIGVELLGSIYERYLGKTIRPTAKTVRVEEKPEVRKAGGVYYTPKYIVDYIVKNTVGKVAEGKTPRQIEKIRILDPACGSGSFLIGAFQYLIDYHVRYLIEHPKEARVHPLFPDLIKDESGEPRLSVIRKARILKNNLFGVDIDPQAVEITMMSLYLKALDGEKSQLPPKHHLLPELKYNIICGNSLIGPDIYSQGTLFGEADRDRINAFDWNSVVAGFGDEMKSGGFNCVIGNPPYGASLGDSEKPYLSQKFKTATSELDTYSMFIERAVGVCAPRGRVSMIVPTGWYSGSKFSKLRQFIAVQTDPQTLINLPYDVFPAWVDTTIFVFSKRAEPTTWPRRSRCGVLLKTFSKRHKIKSLSEFEEDTKFAELTSWFALGGDEFLTYADEATSRIITKMQRTGKPLGEISDVQRGVTPFNLTPTREQKCSVRAFAGTVRRYSIVMGPRRFIRFDDTLAEPKPDRYFKGPRLLLRELISRQFRLQAVKTTEDFVTNKSMQSILQGQAGPALNFILGCVNSRLMSWYFLHRSNIAQRDDFPKIVLKESRGLPIHLPNVHDPADKARHDKLVALVDQMLELHNQKCSAKLAPSELARIDREIGVTDREVDELVYELYKITYEERRLIEEG